MTKKEDLKKRSKEERIVSATILKVSLVYFSFLLYANIRAQVPVNGFCRYREFSVKPNQQNIIPVDFNRDGLRDIVAFDGTDNHYVTLTSDAKSNLGGLSEKSFGVPITDIFPFGNDMSTRQYLLLSRNSREVELTSFSKSGSIGINKRIKLPGYPASLCVGNIDDDNKSECLVSGPSLNGLHIINEVKNVFTDKKVVSGRIFTSSIFIDLDYDGFADIAAFDPIAQSLVFYNNDHAANFNETRSINFTSKITELKAADFNSDGFTDLLFLENGKLEVFLGDSVSSFQKKVVFNSPIPISKYAVFDFNGDGFNDIAFINSETGELYISFAKSTTDFYPPILYMKKKQLVDLAAYVDRAGRKLAVLSSEGKVYLINMVRFDDDNFSVTFGLEPSVVQTFDYLNDKFKDFCFIDKSDLSLKLFLNERRNLFRTFYSVPVSSDYSEMKIDDSRPKIKTFFLYKKNTRLVEIIRIDLGKFQYWKQTVYMNGEISDLKFYSDRLADRDVVTVLINNNNALEIQTLELRDFKVFMYGSDQIAYNVKSSGLALDVFKDVFYLTRNDIGITLSKATFDNKVTDRKNLFTFKVNANEDLHYEIVCSQEPVNRYRPTFVMFGARKNTYFYYLYKNQVNKYELKENMSIAPMLHYYYDEENNDIFLGFKDEIGKLRGINLKLNNKAIEESLLVNSSDVNDFIIQNLGRKRIFLIYSDGNQNTLSFKKY